MEAVALEGALRHQIRLAKNCAHRARGVAKLADVRRRHGPVEKPGDTRQFR